MRKELLQGGLLFTITSLCRLNSQVVEEQHLIPGWLSWGPGKQQLCKWPDLYRHVQQNRVLLQTCAQLLLLLLLVCYTRHLPFVNSLRLNAFLKFT